MKNIFRDRKILYIILCVILIFIFSLTIVYAALSVTLNITGNAEVVASTWDIHLMNPVVKRGSVSTAVPTINGNNLSFSATLTTPGDFYEFTVDVVNDGTIDAMIDSVVKTPELTSDQAKYFKFEVSYQNGESINSEQIIKKGTSTPIKVRIEYRTDLVASDLPSTNQNLSLKLTLIYVQSDGAGSSIINDGHVYAKVINGDYDTIGSEVCIEEECFYVISSTTDTVTMLSKYNLYVGGYFDYSTLNYTSYGADATGIQDKRMGGYIPGQSISHGVTAFMSSYSYPPKYNGSIVEGYVNNYGSYLTNFGISLIEARLITLEELRGLGCSYFSDDGNIPDWLNSTSYWSGSEYAYEFIIVVGSNRGYIDYDFTDNNQFGVRPVITISKTEFKKD